MLISAVGTAVGSKENDRVTASGDSQNLNSGGMGDPLIFLCIFKPDV